MERMERMEKMNQIAVFKEQLEKSQSIAFFGGAGVSTESGIPDFRSADGLYMQEGKRSYSAEELVSHRFFKRHPQSFFDYYFKNLVFENAKPNAGHLFLKELEDAGKDVHVITQNIDGLHQKAGSSHVYELHGSVLRNYCMKCGSKYHLNDLELDKEGIPRCPKDQGIVRPDVVLYQESLNQELVKSAVSAIRKADMLIIAGTSLAVYPAAGLIHDFNGDYLVAINKSPISVPSGTLFFENSISNVLTELRKN